MVKIAPSLLSADFGRLREEVEAIEKAGADMLHFDIMDGHYVPNLTIGPMVVKQLRPYSKLVFDTHLMVANPEEMVPWFAKAGSDIITVHAETVKHLDKTLQQIKDLGKKAGVSLNPATPETILEYVLDKLDLILVMTVNPGFGGQDFISGQIEKIERVKKLIGHRNILLEVDGGINPLTAAKCVAAGADVLVAGTAVFADNNYRDNIDALR